MAARRAACCSSTKTSRRSSFRRSTGWEQGPPDATIAVAADQKIAADSPFRVERFEVGTGLKQARWLRALQLNPSDRRAIRYAAIYDARNGRWLGTWTPIEPGQRHARGIRRAAAGRREADRRDRLSRQHGRSVGRRRAGPVLRGEGAGANAGVDRDRARRRSAWRRARSASASAPKRRSRRATTIAAMWPRLGPGARSIEVTAIRPDGSVEPMLWVNSYPAPSGRRRTS